MDESEFRALEGRLKSLLSEAEKSWSEYCCFSKREANVDSRIERPTCTIANSETTAGSVFFTVSKDTKVYAIKGTQRDGMDDGSRERAQQ